MTQTSRTPDEARVHKIGLLMIAAFVALVALTILAGGGWLLYSASHSERAGVRAAYFVTLPMGFSCTGFVAAIAGHFLIKKSVLLKVGVPVAAGAVGGIGLLAAMFIFFTMIFPAL